MNTEELNDRVNFCLELKSKVRPIIQSGFLNPIVKFEKKEDGSDVTEIDRHVEEVICSEISKRFPGEKILGEEFGEVNGHSEHQWYIDPIDGTKSFVSGVPLFGSMIGIVSGRQSLMGYIDFPMLDETIYAFQGGGCFWQPQQRDEFIKAQTSQVKNLSQSTFCYSSRDYFSQTNEVELYDKICGAVKSTRGWGDCYAHTLVATGRVEFVIDPTCNDWDSAPIQILIEESGGSFFDIQGEKNCLGKSMISTNQFLGGEVKTLLGIS